MNIAIITATYDRKNQSTLDLLQRCWDFISGQSYSKWKWFITGDAYDNIEELENFVKKLPKEKVSFVNLKTPGERGRLKGGRLWFNAGATAMNTSIERALSEGFTWMAHLDDDDVWDTTHLENIFKGISTHKEAICVHTQSNHLKKKEFPHIPGGVTCVGKFNISGKVSHSATAVKFSKTDIRYKTSGPIPADANLFAKLIQEHGLSSIVHIKGVTVQHLDEKNSIVNK